MSQPASSSSKKGNSFAAYDNLSRELQNGLNRMNYKTPTPVQRKALPIALAGMDMVTMARTGSGKTCVFLLPMLAKLKAHKVGGAPRGLVLSPTRELAVQTFNFAKSMSHFMDLRLSLIVGGDGIEAQFRSLSENPDILVATPGRLMHHLHEINTFKLKAVEYLVFDEADRLFEMGFAEQLHEIITQCPVERQTLLFSATMPRQLVQFSRAGLRDPQLIRLDTDVKMSEELRLAFFSMRSNEKLAAFMYLVRTIIPKGQLTLVFTATRHHSEFLHMLLEKNDVPSSVVYGNMDQDARNMNLQKFRSGQVHFLIVTDVAARGIDIPLLNNVINYHFPASPKLFVHRCGRAARAGRTGFAFSLLEPEELAYAADVHVFLGRRVDTTHDTMHTGAPLTPYTLDEMEPDMVQLGLLPQDVLDEETGFLREMLVSNDDLKAAFGVGENAMKLYRKTRGEASRGGVKIAKTLVHDASIRKIHPLIIGCDPKHCNQGAVDKADFIRQLQTFRPSQTVLESGIGSGADQKAAHKRKQKVDGKGVQVMQALRKEMRASLDRTREQAEEEAVADLLGNSGEGGDEEDDEKEEGEQAQTVDWADLESGGVDEFSGDSSNQLNEVDMHANIVVEDPESSGPEVNKGLSRAAQKRLKKKLTKGLGDGTGLEQASTNSDPGPKGRAVASTMTMGKKKNAAQRAADAEKAKFYMTYGDEVTDPSLAFSEEVLQPQAQLKGEAALNATRMEAAMLDLAPDDALALNRKRKSVRWDDRKKKYVRQTEAEAAHSRSSTGRHTTGKDGKSKRAIGELYEKWKKKTKKEVGGDKAVEMDRPTPNVRVNTHVRDELNSADTIKKKYAQKAKNKEKNMEKDKRRKLQNDRKKAKEEAAMKANSKFQTKAGSRKVKAVFVGGRNHR